MPRISIAVFLSAISLTTVALGQVSDGALEKVPEARKAVEKYEARLAVEQESFGRELNALLKKYEEVIARTHEAHADELRRIQDSRTRRGDLDGAVAVSNYLSSLFPPMLEWQGRTLASRNPRGVDPAELVVRQWEHPRWAMRPLHRMEHAMRGSVLTIRNTTGVHHFACVSSRKALEGDFVFQVEFRCMGGDPGLRMYQNSPVDRHLGVDLPAEEWHSAKWTRVNGTMALEINGRRSAFRSQGRGANQSMEVIPSISVPADATVEIRSWSIDPR